MDITGGTTGLYALFSEVPTPGPDPSRDLDAVSVPLPPGYEDTPVTDLEAGFYHGC